MDEKRLYIAKIPILYGGKRARDGKGEGAGVFEEDIEWWGDEGCAHLHNNNNALSNGGGQPRLGCGEIVDVKVFVRQNIEVEGWEDVVRNEAWIEW